MMNRSCILAVVLGFSSAFVTGAVRADAASDAKLNREIGYAKYHLEQFEKEVARERGGDKKVWRSKNDALSRVQALVKEHPDHPEVQALFARAKAALLKSKGEFTEVDPAWTRYKENETRLRRLVWEEGEKAWQTAVAGVGTNLLARVFPAPDHLKVSPEQIEGRYVILDEVLYPFNQFYGGSGEYCFCGKPSEGFYFVQLDGRPWLGAYEAVKRYRRAVDSSMEDVTSWRILGRITGLTMEIPDASEEKVGNMQWGWTVEPVALMVPGHVVSFHDAEAESSGRYAAEEKVAGVKDGWFTVKAVPAEATPERVLEIFMTAIKEKNYDLYAACIDPERQTTPVAKDLLRYHWDLHQGRFHREYIHATFGEAKIEVVAGYDQDDAFDSFFLEEGDRSKLAKGNGEVSRRATVESRAIDPNGKQLGSPTRHTLIQRGNGRWYVDDYATRF